MILSQNKKRFSEFSSTFPESTKNLEYFQTKVEPQRWFLSEIIDCKKRSYLNAQKAAVSERLWTVNILNCPKPCLNPHGTIFMMFFDHSEMISAPKILW